MAHIRKLPNGRFEARYRAPDGRERARRFPTKRDAQAHLDQIGVDRRAGNWTDPRAGRIALSEWAVQWEATTVHLRPSSRARDESYLHNHVLPRFGALRLDAIGVLDVRQWVAELSASGLAPATVHKALPDPEQDPPRRRRRRAAGSDAVPPDRPATDRA